MDICVESELAARFLTRLVELDTARVVQRSGTSAGTDAK